MKVTLYMAQTVNGIIARTNFSEDFLSDENWNVFTALAQGAGCFIVGRKTYDSVKKWKTNFESVNAKCIVVSRSKPKKSSRHITAQSPQDALKLASLLKFKHVILAGGGKLNSAFMKAGLIDEVIIDIEPHVLGKGITIFFEENFEARLKLLSTRTFKGIVQLRYAVVK